MREDALFAAAADPSCAAARAEILHNLVWLCYTAIAEAGGTEESDFAAEVAAAACDHLARQLRVGLARRHTGPGTAQ